MTYSRREFNRMALLAAGASAAGRAGLASGANRSSGDQLAQLYSNSDATALAEHVAKGEVSATELLEEAIRRVELVNPVINAISQKHYDLARAAIKKGQIPRKMVVKGISWAAPLRTKTVRPTGGVIKPTSKTMTMRTPNQMGSNRNASTTGKMIGTVRIMIA